MDEDNWLSFPKGHIVNSRAVIIGVAVLYSVPHIFHGLLSF